MSYIAIKLILALIVFENSAKEVEKPKRCFYFAYVRFASLKMWKDLFISYFSDLLVEAPIKVILTLTVFENAAKEVEMSKICF